MHARRVEPQRTSHDASTHDARGRKKASTRPLALPGSEQLALEPHKVASGPQPRTASEGQRFRSFFKVHLAVMLPITLIVAFILGFGCFDIVNNWGKIHTGVSVQGIDVGGMTKQEASSLLQETLSPTVEDATVTLYESSEIASSDGKQVDDSTNVPEAYAAEASGKDVNGDGDTDTWKITADTIGASVDGDALADEAYQVGREGNFIGERISTYFSTKNIAATLSYNEELFSTLVDEINKAIGTSVKNSKAKISNGKATLSSGHDGVQVDTDLFIKKISASAFNSETSACTIPMVTVTRDIGDDTAQRVVDQINNAITQPVTVTYDNQTWTLDSSKLGSFIRQKVLSEDEVLVIGNGTERVDSSGSSKAEYDVSAGTDENSGSILQAYVKQEAFDKYLVSILGDKATGGATNAKFVVKNGQITIKPSKNGTGPDRSSAEVTLQKILFGDESSNRTITLADTTVEPELTTEEAQSMGIKDKLASWSIPLSGSSSRISNIKLLCKMINGSLVAPGETWSFNETTGERTSEKGFKTAPVIVNGKHEDQLGGGICQVATCIFNCACYSGLGIGTRANHAFYISAYDDKGFADATVSWPSPDLQWINDMSNYILVTASVTSSGNVTVSFWGTDEGRTVTCDRGEWKKGDSYKVVKEYDDSLAAGTTEVEQYGVDGRKITIHYVAKDKDGNVLHDINFKSVYEAQNEIIKVGTKGSSSSSDDDSSDSSSDSSDESSSDSSDE
ncbi:MAG: VanW family protein [Coriobacteriales bacterium]